MNCKQVQELLPLYIGGDLEETHTQFVTAHVQVCAECADSVDEYREIQQLLRLYDPPPFSEAVYAGIRRRVLHEIGEKSSARSLPTLVASLVRPRPGWAFATALLLAVSVLAFYFIANWTNDRQQIVDRSAPVDQSNQDETAAPMGFESKSSATSAPSPSTATPGRMPRADTSTAGITKPTEQSPKRNGSGAISERRESITAITSDTRSVNLDALPQSNNMAEPEVVPAGDPATSERILRVEMQTKDPNIRIIWFSHQPNKQDAPTKFSRGV